MKITPRFSSTDHCATTLREGDAEPADAHLDPVTRRRPGDRHAHFNLARALGPERAEGVAHERLALLASPCTGGAG